MLSKSNTKTNVVVFDSLENAITYVNLNYYFKALKPDELIKNLTDNNIGKAKDGTILIVDYLGLL